MSNINLSSTNYQAQTNLVKGKSRLAQNPSFGNAATDLADFANMYGEKHIMPKIGIKGWLGKLTQFLAETKGEIQSQGVNSFFTFTLAPAFIAFNPISKQDDKTKKYTALRQPISALNAIAVSVPLTMMINKNTNKIASEGGIKAIDLRCCPNKDYLGRFFESEYKQVKNNPEAEKKFFASFAKPEEIEKKKAEVESRFKNLEGAKYDKKVKKAFDKELKNLYVNAKRNEAKEFFTYLLHSDPEKLLEDLELNNDAGKKLAEKLKTHHIKDLREYLKDNNLKSVDAKTFMQKHFGTDLYKEKVVKDGKTIIVSELKETAFEKQLKKIKAIDFLRKLGLVAHQVENNGSLSTESFTEANLRKFLCIKREEPVAKCISESLGVSQKVGEKIVSALGKMGFRHMEFSLNGLHFKEESLTMEQMLHTLKIDQKEFNHAIQNNTHSQLADMFANKLKGLEGLKGTSPKAVATQLMENSLKALERRYSGMKNFIGIFFNLGIVAITCTTLNWAYPRIVERLFPSLVKDSPKTDPKEGGNK